MGDRVQRLWKWGYPHSRQCAHWFAMTCRRWGRGYVCKDVSAMDTLGRGRGLPWHYVAAEADACHVSACHCEERSDVAIRISCGSTQQNATIPGEYVEAADLP